MGPKGLLYLSTDKSADGTSVNLHAPSSIGRSTDPEASEAGYRRLRPGDFRRIPGMLDAVLGFLPWHPLPWPPRSDDALGSRARRI